MGLIIINLTNKIPIIILSKIFMRSLYKCLQVVAILKILLVGANESIMFRKY